MTNIFSKSEILRFVQNDEGKLELHNDRHCVPVHEPNVRRRMWFRSIQYAVSNTPEQSKIQNPKPKIDADLDSRLAPGEVLLWRGKPERRPFVYRTWPLSIFGGALVLASLSYEVVILTTEAPDLLALVGLLFLLIALYMAFGHFLVTSREWRNTEYLVSERQVLIRHGIFQPSITSYSLHGLPNTIVEMHGPDVGNLMFKPREGQGYGPYPGYQTMWPYTPDYILGFLYIRDPGHVQEIIEQARWGK